LVAAFFDDALRRDRQIGWRNLLSVLRKGRHKYAAYFIHLGFVCVAMGVAGSSLGTQRQEFMLDEGAVIDWAGQRIRYVRLEQRQLPDKLVAEAVLELDRGQSTPIELRPARHLHLLQNQWTTEVAIYSTWRGDLYTVLDAGLGNGKVALTLVNNPMIRWIWAGGTIITLSAVIAIWPSRRSRQATAITSHTSSAETMVNGDDRHASAA
jgi:cytochrome c-type biogenesis protein CcmF